MFEFQILSSNTRQRTYGFLTGKILLREFFLFYLQSAIQYNKNDFDVDS